MRGSTVASFLSLYVTLIIGSFADVPFSSSFSILVPRMRCLGGMAARNSLAVLAVVKRGYDKARHGGVYTCFVSISSGMEGNKEGRVGDCVTYLLCQRG